MAARHTERTGNETAYLLWALMLAGIGVVIWLSQLREDAPAGGRSSPVASPEVRGDDAARPGTRAGEDADGPGVEAPGERDDVPGPTGAEAIVDQVVGPGHPAWGCIGDMPVYIQEWHVWWGFPYPDPERPFRHMTSTMTSYLEPWRLEWDRNGYPLIGLYDATNIEVARWQMRCMKACGITSAAVMLHPTASASGGLAFEQEGEIWGNFIPRLLDAAAAEEFPIFFMDEVAFMQGKPREPAVMTKRVIRFLKQYGAHPGFYKIDGEPVYYYQTFGYWLGADVTERMMADVERAIGPVHWIIFGGVGELVNVPQVSAIVCGASAHFQDRTTRAWKPDTWGVNTHGIVAKAHEHRKIATNLNHLKYENTSQPWRPPGVPMYGYRGERMIRILRDAVDAKSDFLMLSSWNDWEEGTNLEPGWDIDGFAGDPYLYCRILAGMRGREFVPPAPPPKEAVHPTIWEKLGHGDGAGPIIDRVRRTHQRGGGFEVVVRDSASAVTRLEVAWNGDLHWTAPQSGSDAPEANVELASGAFGEAETVFSTINPRFTIGKACTIMSEELRFVPREGAPELGTRPAVGAVYALDELAPFAGLSASFSLAHGKPRDDGRPGARIGLRLYPHNKPEDIGAHVWEGWHARVARSPAPVRVGRNDPLVVRVGGGSPSPRRVAHVSLLGEPRTERMHEGAPLPMGGSDRIVRFYVPIPVERLDRPGLQCVWFRAQDAAGNWGSPRLVPVPNYEFPVDKPKARQKSDVDRDWRERTGAAFACRFETNETKWTKVFPAGGGGGGATATERRVVTNRHFRLSNYVVRSDFAHPVTGSFRMRARMLHTNSPRAGLIWLTDATGSAGYGMCWTNHASDRDGGEGVVFIVSFRKEGELDFHEKTQKRLTTPIRSGHRATSHPLADVELDYDAAKRTLTLRVDGVEKGVAKDIAPLTLGRLYLRGNDTILFDDIEVAPVGRPTGTVTAPK